MKKNIERLFSVSKSFNKLGIILFLILFSFSITLNLVAVSANWKENTIKNFNQGKVEEVRKIITSFQPYTSEDKSFILYYKAKIQLDKTSTKNYLIELIEKYQERKYGQFGLLELAKLNIAEKNFEEAKTNLDAIESKKLVEKFYWRAQLFFKTKKFESAIDEAQQFVNKSDNNDFIELCYLLMVESKIEQKKYEEALEILAEFKNSEFIEHQIAALFFKTGYCYEKTGKIDEASKYYKQVVNQFTYTKFDNDSRFRLNKLKNISNETDSEITDIESDQTNDDIEKLYLQAGAFSSKRNAERRVKQIKDLSFSCHIFEEKAKFKVAVGPLPNIPALEKTKKMLKDNHITTFKIVR